MPTPEFNTIEEARAEIVRLMQDNTRLTNERDTMAANNQQLAADLEQVRQLNQRYFNELTAELSGQGDKPNEDDQPAPTCEEFAAQLNI